MRAPSRSGACVGSVAGGGADHGRRLAGDRRRPRAAARAPACRLEHEAVSARGHGLRHGSPRAAGRAACGGRLTAAVLGRHTTARARAAETPQATIARRAWPRSAPPASSISSRPVDRPNRGRRAATGSRLRPDLTIHHRRGPLNQVANVVRHPVGRGADRRLRSRPVLAQRDRKQRPATAVNELPRHETRHLPDDRHKPLLNSARELRHIAAVVLADRCVHSSHPLAWAEPRRPSPAASIHQPAPAPRRGSWTGSSRSWRGRRSGCGWRSRDSSRTRSSVPSTSRISPPAIHRRPSTGPSSSAPSTAAGAG